jgi:hypothetical protein
VYPMHSTNGGTPIDFVPCSKTPNPNPKLKPLPPLTPKPNRNISSQRDIRGRLLYRMQEEPEEARRDLSRGVSLGTELPC